MSVAAASLHAPAPPLPMLAGARHPDAWHAVTAPGGYEWWYFDAESDDGRTRLVAILLDGFVFHPEYLRRYARYLRRPTRVPPPVARDYPCVYFVVYRDGRLAGQFMSQYAPGTLEADADGPNVAIGPNRMRFDGSAWRLEVSGTPWVLTARGPRTLAGRTLGADLTFFPTIETSMVERRFLSRAMTRADHHWVLPAPLCHVAGAIDLGDGQRLDFTGRGYHDHNYGTGPIGPGLRRWIWGRVLLEDEVIAFHFAQPRDARLAGEVHVLRATTAGTQEVDVPPPQAAWSRRTGWLLAYPEALDFGPALRLRRPAVIDSAPFYLRLAYEAEAAGRRGSAFCEIAYPRRLRHPVLGRMIQMSIERRGAS